MIMSHNPPDPVHALIAKAVADAYLQLLQLAMFEQTSSAGSEQKSAM